MGRKTYRNKGKKDNIVISIAGAHGVGKTTIFYKLKKDVEDNYKFKFFPERYVKKPPFPFGSKNKQIAFRSEMHFLQQFIRRNKNVWNFDNRYNGRILILDRTPLCVLVYSKSLFLKEKDYNLILDMFNSVKWREDYIIYLTADPETIIKRTIRRGSLEKIRSQWNETEREYLENVLSFYNQFLVNEQKEEKIFIINTEDMNPDDVLKKIKEIITKLSDYSFKTHIEHPSTQMNLFRFLKRK
ncbi:MAG: AAA family ATPase [Candidatus Lokiarchaeota archaeon]|nr:AAA family ATPase [Candidatus Lokiarchaeota archaeon]MBD3200177.1 AAA family ATPase [Candidatus Lokiarchaeota archaeon]